MKSIWHSLVCAGGLLLCSICHGQASGSSSLAFNIHAQSLEQALTEFGRTTGLQVFFKSDMVAEQSAPEVVGTLSPEEALQRLLAGSHLRYEFINSKTVAIRQKTPSISQDTASGGMQSASSIRLAQAASPESQDAPTLLALDQSPGGQPASLNEVVITGTHIRGVTPDSSMLTVYDRAAIERTGASTTPEFVRKLPQNFALVDSGTILGPSTPDINNNVYRSTAINLHGIGPGSTLVLLDGHRLAPSGIDGSVVDVSMISLSAIDRVEVMSDGASAIYGSDAIAGVVNFVLRKNFTGAETTVRYGSTSQGGGAKRGISQLLGHAWGGGHALLALDYQEEDPIRASQRDFIPPVPERRLILPDQEGQTVLLTAGQELGADIDVFTNLIFSKRNVVSDLDVAGATNRFDGSTKQYGAVLGVGRDFSNGWRGQLVGNYSENKGDLTAIATYEGVPEPFNQQILTYISASKFTSLELNADGRVLDLPAGAMRLSVGGGIRREEFDDSGTSNTVAGVTSSNSTVPGGAERDVTNLYAEVFIPIVGEANATRFARRFELSLAGRHDRYEDAGSATVPKAGVLWSPVTGLKLRSTFAKSFRAAPVAQLSDGNRLYSLLPLPDASSPTFQTNTLLLDAAGNSGLQPERSKSWTSGADIEIHRLKGLVLSLSYFDITYSGRIGRPPITNDFFAPELQPFFVRSPDSSEVSRIFGEEPLYNPLGLTEGDVQAIYDLRVHNISESRSRGLDLSTDYHVATGIGDWGAYAGGSYFIENTFRALPDTPEVDLRNMLYQPADLKLRGGVTWARRGLSSSLALNYTSGYKNEFAVSSPQVSSWTTADIQIGYRTSSGSGSRDNPNLALTLTVQNVTNKKPPFVAPLLTDDLGYDPINASPIGRYTSVSVSKHW